MDNSRRSFLKLGAVAGSGWLMPGVSFAAAQAAVPPATAGTPLLYNNELLNTGYSLLEQWGEGLLNLQYKLPVKGMQGGIVCPACAMVHGRSGDAIFPFLLLADKKKDSRYLDAAHQLYSWMETMVSMPDGSWVNEVSVSAWAGITVFGAISLAESLIHFGHLLDNKTKEIWTARLSRAAEYLYHTFTIDTGNINYPITCCYALTLIGNYLGKPAYNEKAKLLARQCLQYFTPADHLIFGEGKPIPQISKKGCYSVDLGYNVEESLPALVLYARLANDVEILERVEASLRSHLEFMLPDGGWDNSWGTRNFKWTYWGSRTSDGCQPAFALMAGKDPVFYKAALLNTQLLQQCTHNNLLNGGPHFVQQGVLPCVHHSFSHSKAIATMLIHAGDVQEPAPATPVQLPREKETGVTFFRDVNTWLMAKAAWRATVTGYDQEYLMKNGHATGGALTLLWHQKAGPLIVAGMNEYQMEEPFNMQRDKGAFSICLTPRFELEENGVRYMNIADLSAAVDYTDDGSSTLFRSASRLVNGNQQMPASGGNCNISYRFSASDITIQASCQLKKDAGMLIFFLPVVATVNETVKRLSERKIAIVKERCTVVVEADQAFEINSNQRVFNHVPGLQALPVTFSHNKVNIRMHIV